MVLHGTLNTDEVVARVSVSTETGESRGKTTLWSTADPLSGENSKGKNSKGHEQSTVTIKLFFG